MTIAIQMSLPLEPSSTDECYIDQAPYQIVAFDRILSSCYTKHGIQEIESEYIRLITMTQYDPEKLRFEIETNPHLHPFMKANLIHNLESYVKSDIRRNEPVEREHTCESYLEYYREPAEEEESSFSDLLPF
jgi:hypothetical protein